MSLAATTCYVTRPGTCYFHGALPHSMCTVGYVVDPGASPRLTAMTTCTPRSPTVTISPLSAVIPLPASLAVLNVQNTCHHDSHHDCHHNCHHDCHQYCHHGSPSPTITGLVFTAPSVSPLVALEEDLCHHKIRYDLSKDLDAVRVSGQCGPITDGQRCSLVVEGALHRSFRIAFDHPVLTSTIDFEGSLMIEDLFKELHSHFHKRPSSREMSDLGKDRHLYQMAVDTQSKRCGAAFDPHREWDRGMKRVDILGKECKFRGIYLDTPHTSDYLTLRVIFGK